MDITVGPPGSGKTDRLIEQCAQHGYWMVCPTMKEAARIHARAVKRGLKIRFPLCFDEFLKKRYHNTQDGIVIDQVDRLLAYLNLAPIREITMRQEESDCVREL